MASTKIPDNRENGVSLSREPPERGGARQYGDRNEQAVGISVKCST